VILAPVAAPQRTPVAAAASRNHDFPEKLQPIFVRGRWRYKALYGGRGGAKSWGVARALLLLGSMAPERILCAREVQDSIDQSVHQLLRDQIAAMGLSEFYQVLKDEIRGRNGTLFRFKGLSKETEDSIKSFEGITITWVEEAHSISESSWGKLTPTVRRKGSEIWMTLNPDMDTDPTWTRFCEFPDPDVLRIEINWRDNPWYDDTELPKERERDLRILSKADYEHKWEGKPKRVAAGAIYEHEVTSIYETGRVLPVHYDPKLSVHTVWDLGFNDSMAIAFVQRSPREVRVIDYLEDSGRRLDWYVGEIEKIGRDWRWGKDFIPHDGGSGNYITGQSTEEHLRDLKRQPVVLERPDLEEAIKTTRLLFPRVVFNRMPVDPQDPGRGTGRLLECLKRYRRAVPRSTAEPAKPVHDAFSHGADCFRYIAQAEPLMSNDLDLGAVRNFVNRDRSKRLWKK
jgi:phage terminase large subunit